MKKFLIILAAAIATGADTMAAPVSPDEALSRAVTTSAARLGAKAGGYTLRHTCKTDGRNAVYLFESPSADGFLMTPADDVLPAVLGYGKAEISRQRAAAPRAGRPRTDRTTLRHALEPELPLQ